MDKSKGLEKLKEQLCDSKDLAERAGYRAEEAATTCDKALRLATDMLRGLKKAAFTKNSKALSKTPQSQEEASLAAELWLLVGCVVARLVMNELWLQVGCLAARLGMNHVTESPSPTNTHTHVLV